MVKKVFPVIGLAVFSTMLGVGILTPILPIYASDLGATGVWIGIIAGSYSVSRALVMPLVGRWSDRKGRKVFLGVGLLIYAVVSLLYIVSDSLLSLLIVRLIQGAVSGMIIPVARAWIGDISPEGEEGRWQGYFNTAFFSGSAAGPFLGGTLADLFNIDYAFAAMGVMNLISFLAVTIFLRDIIERKPADRPRPSFRALSRSPLFKALFIQRSTLEIGMAIYIVFLPLWAYQELALSRLYIGALVGGALLVSSWLQLLTGQLADKFDRRKLVVMGTIFNFAMVAAVPLAGSLVALVVLIILRSLGGAISMPGHAALSVTLGRRFGMGSTIAILSLATSVGMAVGPILAGFIHDYLGGIEATFYFGAGIGIIGVAFFGWLGYREKTVAPEALAGTAKPA
ncbi:MAG: MFS transporter [Chloroflexota bacterium]